MSALREVFARFTTRFDDRPLRQGAAATAALTSRMTKLAGVFGGMFAIGAVRGSIRDFAAMGDELGKTSKVVGISTAALQAWRHASNLSGVGAEAFNSGLIRLQRNMLEATRGSKAAQESFQRLGVQVTDSSGQLRPVEAVLMDMADPLANMASESEKVATLATLMGRSGARMGPLFAQGAAGVREMMGELSELGGGLSQEAIKASEDYNDSLARLDLAFLSLKSRIGASVLPALQRLAEGFTKIVSQTKILPAILTVGIAAGALKAASALKALGIQGALANAKILGGWALIAAGILVAVLLVEDFIVALDGGKSLMGDLNDGMRDFVELHEDEDSGLGFVARWWDNLSDAVERVIGAVGEFLGFDAAPDYEDVESGEFTSVRGLRPPGARTAEQEIADQLREDGEIGMFTTHAQVNRRVRRVLETGSADLQAARPTIDDIATTSVRGLQPPPNVNQEVSVAVTVNESQDPEKTRRAVVQAMDEAMRNLVDGATSVPLSGVASGEGI